MSLSLKELAEDALAAVHIDENLHFDSSFQKLTESPGVGVTCETVRLRIETVLKGDRKKKATEKVIPELERTPYATLLAKICGEDFSPDQLSISERAVLGFLPIHSDNTRVRGLLKIVAEKIAGTYKKEGEEVEKSIMEAAERTVFAALTRNLWLSRNRAFKEIPIDLGFLKNELKITPKALGDLVARLKAEGKRGTEDLLKALGFTEEEIPALNKEIIEAGKQAVKFYREIGAKIRDGQRRFVAQDHTRVLRGTLVKIGPDIEESQADLFTLLERAYSKETEIGQKCTAQILLQIRLLCMMICNDPVYQALIDSNAVLSKGTHVLLKDTTKLEIEIRDEEFTEMVNETEDEDDRKTFQFDILTDPYTLRGFEEDMPPIYMDEKIRDKDWPSIMVKIMTGKSPIESIIDILAGQGAIYEVNKDDLIFEEGSQDFDKIEKVNKLTDYIKRICVRTAEAMGCSEDLSNEDLSEEGTDYHYLQPGQFKIVKKIHGDASNDKTHNFSAFKIYMAVETKNGTVLRLEWRYLPWDTYVNSKSKKSLTGDVNYSLKKLLIFARSAFRRSQNERFINVVERLLELLSELEYAERIEKNGSTASA